MQQTEQPYNIPQLSNLSEIETKKVLKKLISAHQALAEFKGVTSTMPNQNILINTLSLQEAKDSSEIENIITTHDELYLSNNSNDNAQRHFITQAAKEVHGYASALRRGFERVKETGLLTNNDILAIQAEIEENQAGFRKQAGTVLKNDSTGQVIYTPPQHPDDINRLMNDLEKFINQPDNCDWDSLIKMAVIHHQFESIHPFYDGNGRTGRVINILYLVQQGLLDTPVLYLSRYINQNKEDYYRLLQSTRTESNWEEWLLYMLDAIEQTAKQTTELVINIKELMQAYKHIVREKLPKAYSQELINNLFRHPYTKIDFVAEELKVTRKTASKYLEELVEIKLLSKHKIGTKNYYLNESLFNLLDNVNQPQKLGHSETR